MAKVEVRFIGGSKGKGLFALQNFKSGEVLFTERPLVSCQFVWNEYYGYKSCDFCMKPLEDAQENSRRLANKPDIVLPYFPQCCIIDKSNQCKCHFECGKNYCNERCRAEALDQYHQVLCLKNPNVPPEKRQSLAQLLEVWKRQHFPPETSSITLITRIIASILQASDREGALGLFRQFCCKAVNEKEQIAHKLLGEQFKSQLNVLRELVAKALYDPLLHEWFTPDGFLSLIALIGTNGQGIGTSSLSAWANNCDIIDLTDDQRKDLDDFTDKLYEDIDDESGPFMNNEGSGLFPLQSSCNHSCEPNVEATFPFSDFTLVMQCIRDIKAGDEILVSYLDECACQRSRHSRNKILRENYLFTCDCRKCESEKNDPDVTSEESEISENEEEAMICDS